MENIENKIYALMRKSATMREIYQKYPRLKDNELLSELECQAKLEDMISERPIIKESLIGFSRFLELKPSEILDYIEYKSDIDIRMDFEKMKREKGLHTGQKEFGTDKGGFFKSGIPDDMGGSDFSGGPNSLNI